LSAALAEFLYNLSDGPKFASASVDINESVSKLSAVEIDEAPVVVRAPVATAPVVEIAPAPTSILVNPDVIEPESNAPTDTRPVLCCSSDCSS
jgi:hypothetical protein